MDTSSLLSADLLNKKPDPPGQFLLDLLKRSPGGCKPENDSQPKSLLTLSTICKDSSSEEEESSSDEESEYDNDEKKEDDDDEEDSDDDCIPNNLINKNVDNEWDLEDHDEDALTEEQLKPNKIENIKKKGKYLVLIIVLIKIIHRHD